MTNIGVGPPHEIEDLAIFIPERRLISAAKLIGPSGLDGELWHPSQISIETRDIGDDLEHSAAGLAKA